MLWYLALAGGALVLIVAGVRFLVTVPPGDLAQAARTFAAVFSALASTGLIFTGRFGLAVITIAATVMAVRAMRVRRMNGTGRAGPGSNVKTDLLEMRLDHATGALEGTVRRGPLAGRALDDLDLASLLTLLSTARSDDPPSVRLLETYLDRRQPDWRARGEPHGGAEGGVMDERTALEILGLERGASAEEIKVAHRRLMARLHPDHGGSGYLASQINRARDFLLRQG